MSNADRLPRRKALVEFFGPGFITDTYETAAESHGYGEMMPKDPLNMGGSEHTIHSAAEPGSVITQYVELVWSVHRDEFWDWRCSK